MRTPDAPRAGVSGVPAVPESGPTRSLWLRILVRCAGTSVVALAVAAAVAFLVSGGAAALSSLFGWGIVALFFGVSLLIGHFVGRDNPSGALGIFAVTYAIKVVGFAAALFFVGTPDWLDRTWFFASAVGTVILWQVVEIAVFARTRHQLYDHAPTSSKEADGHA